MADYIRKFRVILILIFITGLLLRIYQAGYALPAVSHEEYVTLGRAWMMWKTKSLNPGWFSWPSLLTYLHLTLLTVMHLFGPVEWSAYVYVSRFLQILIGAATVILVYLIGRKAYSHGTGLAAASIVSLLPVHVLYSQIARPEVLIPFFYLIVLLLSLQPSAASRVRYFILSGVLAGLATATKYNGILTLLTPVGLYTMNLLKKQARFGFSPLPILFTVTAGVFILFNPYSILDHRTFLLGLLFQGHRVEIHSVTHFMLTARIFTLALGIPLFILSIIGVIAAAYRRQKIDTIMLIGLASPLTLVLIWDPSSRLLLTPMVILAIFAARAFELGFLRLRRAVSRLVLYPISGIMVFLILATPIFQLASFFPQRTRPSVSEKVYSILARCVPPGSRVYWGMDASAPLETKSGQPIYLASGDYEPDFTYHSYERFRAENFSAVILTESHRRYLEDSGFADPETRGFYTRFVKDYEAVAIPWNRLTPRYLSAPVSQTLTREQQTQGVMYVYIRSGSGHCAN